ncbi:MAG: cytidine deaminase [Chloroflexota bacterium]
MQPQDSEVQSLLRQAQEAARRAYCPYSRFPVGAAVLTASGEAFAGANVENASYGLTLCAERVAAAQAVSAGHRRLRAVVVYTPTAAPTPPCGACRQFLNEFGPDMEVFSFAENGVVQRCELSDLLPGAFGPGSLAAGEERAR